MGDEIHEECGIAAVSLPHDQPHALFSLYKMLLNMQNRGQLSAGITTYLPDRAQIIDTHKDLGTVDEVFRTSSQPKSRYIFTRYAGQRGIGHTRYATCGKNDKSYAQPFERHHGRKWKWFSFAFNGNLANYSDLRQKLVADQDYHLVRDNDTEIIMHHLSKQFASEQKPELVDVWRGLAKEFDGAYNMAFINAAGDLAASKDPLGLRPLSYTIVDDALYVASESAALIQLGLTEFKELEPGTIITATNGTGEIRKERYADASKTANCMFEWVYFSNVSSVINGSSVYVSRYRMGEELAKVEPLSFHKSDTIVVPVPDTGKAAGDAYAYTLGLPSREGLVRNRFLGRAFIDGDRREDKVRNKFTVIKHIVAGKRVILVDDSIVRGVTSKAIIDYVRNVGGAKEVHLRLACPPIIAPCFYGIDMSTVKELIAPQFRNKDGEMTQEALDDMAREIGADSIVFQTIPGLVRAIGLPQKELCTACLTGKYPTPWGQKLYELALKTNDKGRTYEMIVKS